MCDHLGIASDTSNSKIDYREDEVLKVQVIVCFRMAAIFSIVRSWTSASSLSQTSCTGQIRVCTSQVHAVSWIGRCNYILSLIVKDFIAGNQVSSNVSQVSTLVFKVRLPHNESTYDSD